MYSLLLGHLNSDWLCTGIPQKSWASCGRCNHPWVLQRWLWLLFPSLYMRTDSLSQNHQELITCWYQAFRNIHISVCPTGHSVAHSAWPVVTMNLGAWVYRYSFLCNTPLVPCLCSQPHLCNKFRVSEQFLQTGTWLILSRVNTCPKGRDSPCGNPISGENKERENSEKEVCLPHPSVLFHTKEAEEEERRKSRRESCLGLSQTNLSALKNKLVE